MRSSLSRRKWSSNVLGTRAEMSVEEEGAKNASVYISTTQATWLSSLYGPVENLILWEVTASELKAEQLSINVKDAALKRRAGKFQKTGSELSLTKQVFKVSTVANGKRRGGRLPEKPRHSVVIDSRK
ncbi:hypothetical protein R1flu_003180 [Riccia fluitans]|uniref:Uncharacterized protein n=1 Tax=Riccia fluitans TaxID=41844 RepID=A0ABD1Y8F0_9MARC